MLLRSIRALGRTLLCFFFHSHIYPLTTHTSSLHLDTISGPKTEISPRKDVEKRSLFGEKRVRLCLCSCQIETEEVYVWGPNPLAERQTERNRIGGAKREGLVEDLGHRLPRGIVYCVCVYACVCGGGFVNEYVCKVSFCMCVSRVPVSVTQQISWLKPIVSSFLFLKGRGTTQNIFNWESMLL